MDDKIFFILLAILLFVLVGPLKLSGVQINGGERMRPENYRFRTPGRNGRQRQLAADKEDRRKGKQSQGQEQDQAPATAMREEPIVEEDPEVIAKTQAEERARRAAAAEARFIKDKTNQELARKLIAQKKREKGRSALEQASYENRGWRAADEAADFRSWN